ncbi:MAG: ABC transporter ATP-binding protein [Planctomycetes bacterium]|nr:ABC transporter ATP-binding protein [Planctomycetota bacterium]NOG52825.1 ABC transporter ATP-binding protein [Planctomycetota bacterium]
MQEAQDTSSGTTGTVRIRVEDARKSYRRGSDRTVQALDGATLTVTEPGFYAIMGPSGSGKSTLLHMMAGLDRLDGGRIHVNGHDLHSMSERELTRFRRLAVGVVFQQFNLIPTMTALDNVAMPALLDGRASRWARHRADELLGMLGLGDRVGHRPDALSGGEQQRVAIARALVFEPALVLADEPTGNLDSMASADIWRMLADLARDRSIAVMMVTHEPAGAAHARSVFVLRDGRIHEQIDVGDHDAGWLASRYQQSHV